MYDLKICGGKIVDGTGMISGGANPTFMLTHYGKPTGARPGRLVRRAR